MIYPASPTRSNNCTTDEQVQSESQKVAGITNYEYRQKHEGSTSETNVLRLDGAPVIALANDESAATSVVRGGAMR